ncbi:MAG TPA: substrate binding domain-containing protein, partial [Thauera aminoaromatica]|nr:substrate binding domain-containing protein [Thauera aminoaromatica]
AIRIAALPSSTLVCRQLARTRIVLCAAPAYLAAHGAPRLPADLASHTVIAYSYWSGGDEWQFDGPDGRVSVRTRPAVHTNSGDTCRAMALAGQGVILQPGFLVAEDLAAGALVELMPAYRSVTLGIYALYPTRKFVPPKVRALVDFLAERFAAPPPGW